MALTTCGGSGDFAGKGIRRPVVHANHLALDLKFIFHSCFIYFADDATECKLLGESGNRQQKPIQAER